MIRGSDVNFTDINSPHQLRRLNDIINYMLSVLREKCSDVIIFKTVECTAGQWTDVEYGQTFEINPVTVAYSNDGKIVKIRKKPGNSDMRKSLQIAFEDVAVSGSVNVAVIGKSVVKY